MCGSRWGDHPDDRRRYFAEIEESRYQLDYMLKDFARFEEAKGKRVLEVGLGTGTDFVQWVRAGALAHGRDLTDASVELTKERLALEGFADAADVRVGDAEALEFPDSSFDIYYSWGVLHHTPNTERAFAEAARVLKPGGSFRVMLYHYHSVSAVLVWLAQGPLKGRFVGIRGAYAAATESPGTQLFSRGGGGEPWQRNIFSRNQSRSRRFSALVTCSIIGCRSDTHRRCGDSRRRSIRRGSSSTCWGIDSAQCSRSARRSSRQALATSLRRSALRARCCRIRSFSTAARCSYV